MNDLRNPSDVATRSDANGLRERVAAEGLDWIVPDWNAPRRVNAFTTTRMNAEAHLNALLPSEPVSLEQVHGADVAVLDSRTLATARAARPVADAAVTRLRGVACSVATADCLPVVFADTRGEAIGVAHAGWRGLAAGVLEHTVAALGGIGAEPAELVVWFGPAIGPHAFEVGSDVFTAFCDDDREMRPCFVPYREGKWLADIYALARHRLARCGVHEVSGGRWCTYSQTERFYSYRRGRHAGRMLTLVWLAPDHPGRPED